MADSFDVFISYQRASEAVASVIHQRLTVEGFRVWQDVHDIRHTDRWNDAIQEALQHTDRLLLLMTPAAMDSQEVSNEWFFFYTKRKPIHCLLVEDCEIHYQLLPLQYIDWKNPQPADWERLLNALRGDYAPPAYDTVITTGTAPERTLPEAMTDLLRAIQNNESIQLTPAKTDEIARKKPDDLTEYHLGRIAEWSAPKYQLDNRFVRLTLVPKREEEAGPMGIPKQPKTCTDLQAVLDEIAEPAIVLLGDPGSGKSTLLRRYQLDSAIRAIRSDTEMFTFFVQLNLYRGADSNEPGFAYEWLRQTWRDRYPNLPDLDTFVRQGKVLFLLDAINEMRHRNSADYREKVEVWQHFLATVIKNNPGNRAVFTCRIIDYSAPLGSDEVTVPHIQVNPLTPEQIQEFLRVYIPGQAEAIWRQLDGTPQAELFNNPYLLSLLVNQIGSADTIPDGRAALFTGFVRQALQREIKRKNRLLNPNGLIDEDEYTAITQNQWGGAYDLPRRGRLIPKLSELAFGMQTTQDGGTDNAEVSLEYDYACQLLNDERDRDIIRVGVALNALDHDLGNGQVKFLHQLLQEFFAARQFADDPNPELVTTAWRADEVFPSLEEALQSAEDNDEPLPPLDATGWEETTILAATMAQDADAFVRTIMGVNLTLAARCAASPDVTVTDELKSELQAALLARTENREADLRARIDAGLRLGEVGDPRFERRQGDFGVYLMPPMIDIPAGTYTIGSEDGDSDEKPVHPVTLDAFQLGKFPVTNAEYACFIESGGYEDEQWWDTEEAKLWRVGKYDELKALMAKDFLYDLVFETVYKDRQHKLSPEYWRDERFNQLAQPVVGITWWEARAYCAWLSAQTGLEFRLPTEAEWEAAARGFEHREYAYGKTFERLKCNTEAIRLKQTSPIGVFLDGVTPLGLVDMTGNVWEWMSSLLEDYPYNSSDGREKFFHANNNRRVLRGGSCSISSNLARAAYRSYDYPTSGYLDLGFRVARSS